MSLDNNLILITDFDGTLVETDIGFEFRKWLFNEKKFGFFRLICSVLFYPINLFLNSILSTGSFFSAWSILRNADNRLDLFNQFMNQRGDCFNINDSVMDIIENFEGKRIIVTGSETELIRLFLEYKNINCFNEIYGAKIGILGFIFLNQPRGRSKCKYGYSDVAIGNHYSDRFFLSMSENSYVVKGDDKFVRYATSKGWNILE